MKPAASSNQAVFFPEYDSLKNVGNATLVTYTHQDSKNKKDYPQIPSDVSRRKIKRARWKLS